MEWEAGAARGVERKAAAVAALVTIADVCAAIRTAIGRLRNSENNGFPRRISTSLQRVERERREREKKRDW